MQVVDGKIGKKRRSGNLIEDHLSLESYAPGKLLDMLREVMGVDCDNQLAVSLCMDCSIVSRLRKRKMSLTAGVLIRMHDASGLTIANLRDLAGIPQPIWN